MKTKAEIIKYLNDHGIFTPTKTRMRIVDHSGNPLAPEKPCYKIPFKNTFGSTSRFVVWPETVGFQAYWIKNRERIQMKIKTDKWTVTLPENELVEMQQAPKRPVRILFASNIEKGTRFKNKGVWHTAKRIWMDGE